MAKVPQIKVDFQAMQGKVAGQFQNLNPNDPSSWPAIPRYGICILLFMAVIAAGWFLWLTGTADELQAAQDKEVKLKEEYKKKLVQAVNLDTLKKQREQVQQYVTQLEKQLPSKADIDALLSDINQAGLGRSLQFEAFRPSVVSVKDYYAELPISIKITGTYHDIGAFTSDIANLSRIVTLSSMSLTPIAGKTSDKDKGSLSFDAIAKTYRYLDTEEVAAQKKAVAGAKK